jgi:hypothetical protein
MEETETMRQDNLCSLHRLDPDPGHHCRICARLRMERRIVRKIAQAMLAAGYSVTVNDGEELALVRSRKLSEIMEACFSVDEEHLIAYRADGSRVGFVFLVYGNSGFDVVNDYSMALEDLMKPINDYADEQEMA